MRWLVTFAMTEIKKAVNMILHPLPAVGLEYDNKIILPKLFTKHLVKYRNQAAGLKLGYFTRCLVISPHSHRPKIFYLTLLCKIRGL